jgi:hypothetical protein
MSTFVIHPTIHIFASPSFLYHKLPRSLQLSRLASAAGGEASIYIGSPSQVRQLLHDFFRICFLLGRVTLRMQRSRSPFGIHG